MKDCFTCAYLNGSGFCSRTACTYLSENDFVPVIRCKNCKYYQTADFTDGFTCYLAEGIAFAKEDDFCSRAERKD